MTNFQDNIMPILADFSCINEDCNFVAPSALTLLSHYRAHHTKNLNSPCFYRDCRSAPFKTSYGLHRHTQRYHNEFFNKVPDQTPAVVAIPMEEANEFDLTQEFQESAPTNADNQTNQQAIYAVNKDGFSVKESAARFLLNLSADRKFNQVDLQCVMKEVSTLLTSAGLIATQSEDIFAGLKTQYSQNKFYSNEFNMINHKIISLPTSSLDFKRSKTGQEQQTKPQAYTYVPVLQQLKRILNFEDIYNCIHQPKSLHNEMLSSYEDGSLYETFDLFQKHPCALQVHLYLDEVQVCNELASRTKRNKYVFVYFSLGNVPHKGRSNFKSIYLLSIFSNQQMNRYGLNLLLRPIVDDLKLLENGCEMEIGGTSELVVGTLTAVIADNLAAHQIGGFKSGFSKGFRKCRTCLGTEDEIQNLFFDSDFIARDRKDHDLQVESAKIPELNKHVSRLYGLKDKSILNELKHFHVIGGLVPDVMHDLLEGVIPLTLCDVLLHCIKKKYFAIKQLNTAFANFKYGHKEVIDKPSPVEMNHLKNRKLRQSAVQCWQMATLFPLIFGHRIPYHDLPFFCFTRLLEVCRLVFLDSVSPTDVTNLAILIADFLQQYKSCFDRKIMPKMHHLIHYPKYIRMFGPLNAYWCMRYEAKHSYFKQLQRSIRNYINVPLTLTLRHQQWQCQQFLAAGKNVMEIKFVYPKGKLVSLNNITCGGQLAQDFGVDKLFTVDQFTWVDVGTTKFKVDDSIVLCKLLGTRKSQFGLVTNIINHKGQCRLLCKLFRTKCFNKHFQAFRITSRESECYIALSPLELASFNVYAAHMPSFRRPTSNDFFVSSKSEISHLLL